MTDDAPFKVVGMGLIPLPGEKKAWQKARDEAKRLLRLADEIQSRSPDAADESEEQ